VQDVQQCHYKSVQGIYVSAAGRMLNKCMFKAIVDSVICWTQ